MFCWSLYPSSINCSIRLSIYILLIDLSVIQCIDRFIYNIYFNLLLFCLPIYWSFCQFTNVYFFINLYVDCFVWLFYLSMHHLFYLIWTSIVHFLYFFCAMRLPGCFGRLLTDLVQKNPSWSLCDVMIPKYCLNQSFIVCICFYVL